MVELEVKLLRSGEANIARLERIVDGFCREQALSITMKTTLSKYPGSIHWHIRSRSARGTLELTLWPQRGRAWFSMQDGRKGEWVMITAHRMKQTMEAL